MYVVHTYNPDSLEGESGLWLKATSITNFMTPHSHLSSKLCRRLRTGGPKFQASVAKKFARYNFNGKIWMWWNTPVIPAIQQNLK
jgi:hypothetical protein